jgi:hypothetical protein
MAGIYLINTCHFLYLCLLYALESLYFLCKTAEGGRGNLKFYGQECIYTIYRDSTEQFLLIIPNEYVGDARHKIQLINKETINKVGHFRLLRLYYSSKRQLGFWA